MQKYYHYYEKSYEKFTPEWFDKSNLKKINQYLDENSESMINFIEKYEEQFEWPRSVFQNKKVLVTGCGFGGICKYLERRGAIVTGVDVSSLAIVGAKEIASLNKTRCDFIQADITQPSLFPLSLNENFDYIIDDHLLHCLTTKEDRTSYLSLINSLLLPEGYFFCETMAFHSAIQIPVNYSFDEDHILWKQVDSTQVMIRKIAPSIEVEEDIKSAGFNINYLYYHSELTFNAFSDYTDYPLQYLPKTIRLTASPAKKSK